MTAIELARLVKQLRDTQARYNLWSRVPSVLADCRILERQVDAAVVAILAEAIHQAPPPPLPDKPAGNFTQGSGV